jgi:uncharacterized protein YjdB
MKNLILKLAVAAAVALASACSGDDESGIKAVSLDRASLTVSVGQQNVTLTASLDPGNAPNKAVTWTSSNEAVADVVPQDLSCRINAKTEGTATITVRTQDGGKEATCALEVLGPGSVTGVTFAQPQFSVGLNGTYTLTATVAPATATNKAVTWSSLDPTIATVLGNPTTSSPNQTATVRGIKLGSTVLTVTTVDRAQVANVTVNVVEGKPVTGVTLTPSTFNLYVGETGRLQAALVPGDASNRNVSFLSSDPTVAPITTFSGFTANIRADKAGAARITVTTEDGGYMAFCDVTVNNPPETDVYIGGAFGLVLNGVTQPAYAGAQVTDVQIDASGVVHACGVASNEAVYWKDGVRSTLPRTASAVYAEATALAVEGSNVYVCGYETTQAGGSNTYRAKYWVNGVNTVINDPTEPLWSTTPPGATVHSCANDIMRHNGQTWMVGGVQTQNYSAQDYDPNTGEPNGEPIPGFCLWVVTASAQIAQGWTYTTGWAVDEISSITGPEGNEVYVSGYQFGGVLKMTFTDTNITMAAVMNVSAEEEGRGVATNLAYANNAVYACGYQFGGSYPPAYWIIDEGGPHPYTLPEDMLGGSEWVEAWGIALSPGFVFTCGRELRADQQTFRPKHWRNQTMQTVPAWGASSGNAWAIAVKVK